MSGTGRASPVGGRLPAYFRSRIGLQILALLAVLTALMQLLELLDVTTEVFNRKLGFGGLLYYAALRLPSELMLALPLAVLLGAMTALHAMARSLEITAVRTAGVSLARLFGYLLPVLLALAAFQLALSQWALPRTENTLKLWWNASAPPDTEVKRLWAHTSSGLVSIGSSSADGRRLTGVRVYLRDGDGLLTARLAAAGATWQRAAWRLDDVSELRIEGGGVRISHEGARDWQTNLSPDEVLRLGDSRPHLSSMMLADVIAGARVGTQPLSYYRTVLYRSFTAPLGVFIMLLLALPAACALPRAQRGSHEMLIGLVLGLGFLLADGLVAAFGTSGRLAPIVTALAAPLLFVAIGIARVRACERV